MSLQEPLPMLKHIKYTVILFSWFPFWMTKSPAISAASRSMFRIPILMMTTSLFLCWYSRAKTVISLIVSLTERVMGGGGHFSWIVSSQAVASGPHLLFCKFKHSLVISAPGKANVDLRRKPACHWTPRDWATGSLKHLFLTPASALFHSLSLPKLWQKVCILGETPGDLMDMSPVWNGNPHIQPGRWAPGIFQWRWRKEMEQVGGGKPFLLRSSFQKH